MAKRCFFSFHYKPDSQRASQVRQVGTIEGNKPATNNDWETITVEVTPLFRSRLQIKWMESHARLFLWAVKQQIENGLIMKL